MEDLFDLLNKADAIFEEDKVVYQHNLDKIRNIQTEQDLKNLNGTQKTEDRIDIAYSSYAPISPLERLIGKNNLMDLAYFEKGLEVAKTVCRIIHFDYQEKKGVGTGFMVSPCLMMTNHHVIKSKYWGTQFLAEFNYEKDTKGILKETALFQLEPETFFMTNEDLDFTIIAVAPIAKNQPQKKLLDYGHNSLKASSKKILEGEAVSIIQHPKGLPKMIAIRDNTIVSIKAPYIHYSTDTQKGSSGSLVANDQWDIVALHRSGVASKDEHGNYLSHKGKICRTKADEPLIHWIANQGVLIDYILEDISKRHVKSTEQEVLKEALLKDYTAEKKAEEYRLPKRK